MAIDKNDSNCHRKRAVAKEVHALDNLIGRLLDVRRSKLDEVDGITPYNGRIIGYIARKSDREICQRDIEKEFCITRSTASRVLSLMEQKELIRRVSVSGDARLKRLVLTDCSRRFTEMMQANFDETEEILANGFTPEELEEFFRLCEKLKGNICGALQKQ